MDDNHDSSDSAGSTPSPNTLGTPSAVPMSVPQLLHLRRRSKVLDEEALEAGSDGVSEQESYTTARESAAVKAAHARLSRLWVNDEEMQSPKQVPQFWKRFSVAWAEKKHD